MFTDEQRVQFGEWIGEFERLWRLLIETCQQAHQHRHASAAEVCTDRGCGYFRDHWEATDRFRMELATLYGNTPPGLVVPYELRLGGGGLGSVTDEPIVVPDRDLFEISDRRNGEPSVSVSAGVGPPIVGDNPEEFDLWGWKWRNPRPLPKPAPVPSVSTRSSS